MKRPMLPAVTVILAAVAALVAADPIPPGVGRDASWFAHADLKAFKKTALGKHMLGGLQKGEADSKLAALSMVLNFDPRSALDSLTLYGYGKDGDGAAIVRGAFDGERLVTLVKAAEGYGSQAHNGHTLHSWSDTKRAGGGKRSNGCIYASNTVVFADDPVVLKRALDVLDVCEPALKKADRFPGLTGVDPAAFFVVAADMARMQDIPEQAAAFKAASSTVLSLSESGGQVSASVHIETADPETAGYLKKFLDGMAALALLNAEKDPVGARLARNSDVALDGKRLTVVVRASVDDVIAHMESMLHSRTVRAAGAAPPQP